MAKFAYRMQNILDVKMKMENQAKISYGIANAKLMDENEARELVSGTIDVQKIRDCKRAIDTMKSKQRTQMMNVHVAEKNLEAARLHLNKMMVERKTHEKLKERAVEEFKQELQYAENKEIDELVSYTYHDNMENA